MFESLIKSLVLLGSSRESSIALITMSMLISEIVIVNVLYKAMTHDEVTYDKSFDHRIRPINKLVPLLLGTIINITIFGLVSIL